MFGKDLIDRDAALEKFYNRKPERDEQMTDFFSDLWHLANSAYGEPSEDLDVIVKDRFIKNVPVPYIQLELRKNPPATSYDALNIVVEALKVTNSCKDMRGPPQTREWTNSQATKNQELAEVAQENCRICKQPGHWARNCPQSRYNQNNQQRNYNNQNNQNKPSISNVIAFDRHQKKSKNCTGTLVH